MNQAIKAILSRRSIRRFIDREVKEDDINLLLECACAAPSAANSRPWHFVVVTERGVLDRMGEAHPYGKMLFEAPLAIVVCGDPTKSDYAARYWEEDCSAAMENILIAAASLGLGSVWLGVKHSPEREAAMRAILSVPDHVAILGIAAIGWPGEEKEPHRGIDDGVVHRNRW
ncbi:MAG: nitroreductase family protein [Thermanaerothrix sp.]|nr:nitroreductase family protein [Thermanaerothrix sp.]